MMELLAYVCSLQVSEERWLKAADSEATAVGVGVNPVLIILICSEANNCICIPHTELEDVQAMLNFILLEWRQLMLEVPDGSFHRLELTLRVHVLNVETKTNNCCVFPNDEIQTLKFPLQI
jgi:hypothetical protein